MAGTSPALAAGPWKGQVVDAETGQPLEGVVVLFDWLLDSGTLATSHGGAEFYDAEEVITGPDGRFVIPARRIFTLLPWKHFIREIVIFKPGYGQWAFPWDGAGLRAVPVFGVATVRGQSSLLWQQNADQDTTLVFTPAPFPSGGGTWTWATARSRYLEALTNPTKADQGNQRGRDTAFAELFENLGHVTHVVQDATVPAYTRNDAHPAFVRPDFYEAWVQRNLTVAQGFINAAPTKPSPSIFTTMGNPQAPVPIARLIDTDTFLGANASVLNSANPLIGIGEYTNGNFLSRGTHFRDFVLPQPSSLDLGEVVEAKPDKSPSAPATRIGSS